MLSGESSESPTPAGDEVLRHEVLALRTVIVSAIDAGTGDVSPRKVALLRDALRRCNALAARVGAEPFGEPLVSPAAAHDTNGFVLAGRQAARVGHHPVSVLMLRPRAELRAEPLQRVLEIAQRQLRAMGDIARLLEGERVLAITLESDRPGALVALRRIARALADHQVDLSRFDYSLTELDPTGDGDGAVRRVGEGFHALTVDPERSTPKRVLALDDDPSVLAVIVEHLESSGLDIQVESTTSGYEACVRFGEFEPDLVILDIRMPEIDGRDALSTMKRAANGRAVKFIVASAMPEYFADMIERGCDDTLQKPFELTDLTSKVARLLGFTAEAPSRAA
jgi:CheY-like chemotaxis protein